MLELGGKDAHDRAAPTRTSPNAISGCLWGGFANAGQTCAGIERVYVVSEVAERFIEGVVEGAEALRVGDPLDWDTEIGPMVSREQFELVARARGRRRRERRRRCAAAGPPTCAGYEAPPSTRRPCSPA